MSGAEACEAGTGGRTPLLFLVGTGVETLTVSVDFPYDAYECQVLYMQSVLDALFKARRLEILRSETYLL